MATHQDRIKYLARIKYPLAALSGQHPDHSAYCDYLAELHAKDPAEISRMYDTAIAVFEKRKHEREVQERFYNRPDAVAEWGYWAAMPLWTVDQATALSFGKDPAKVNWEKVRTCLQLYVEFCPDYERRINLLFAAIASGDIQHGNNLTARPRAFIEWGEPRGIRWPSELTAFFPQALTTARAPQESGAIPSNAPAPKVELPPMPPADLAGYFKFPNLRGDPSGDNTSAWKRACSEAKGKLREARRGPPSKGTTPARYDPETVAEWIIEERGGNDDVAKFLGAVKGVLNIIELQTDNPDAYAAMRAKWKAKLP